MIENGGGGYSLLYLFAVEVFFKNSSVHACYIKQGVSERLHSGTKRPLPRSLITLSCPHLSASLVPVF